MDKIKKLLERLLIFIFITFVFMLIMSFCYILYISSEYIIVHNEKIKELIPVFTKGTAFIIVIGGVILYLLGTVSIFQKPMIPDAKN